MKEAVLSFEYAGESLVGIVAEADDSSAEVGVLLVVGGPQYRAGSHRQFVLLARHLAGHGITSLRFDYRGMGDSTGEARDFQDVDADLRAAIDALLANRPALKQVVIWGLCDAASAALMYVEASRDTRVAGLALLNPWARSASTLAQTHVKHYYWRRLREKAFWLKLLRGGVGFSALKGFTRNLRLAHSASHPETKSRSFHDRMATGLQEFPGPILLILSSEDYTAKEFTAWTQASTVDQALAGCPLLDLRELVGADHTLSTQADQDAMCRLVESWLRSRWPDTFNH